MGCVAMQSRKPTFAAFQQAKKRMDLVANPPTPCLFGTMHTGRWSSRLGHAVGRGLSP